MQQTVGKHVQGGLDQLSRTGGTNNCAIDAAEVAEAKDLGGVVAVQFKKKSALHTISRRLEGKVMAAKGTATYETAE